MAIKLTEFLKEFDERAKKAAEEIEIKMDSLFKHKKFLILDNGDIMFERIYYFRTNQELDKKIFEILKNTFLINGWANVELFNDSSIILRYKLIKGINI